MHYTIKNTGGAIAMAVYILHVVDQVEGKLKVPHSQHADSFDYVFEILAGKYAGQRGTHHELSRLVVDPLVVLSSRVGLCHKTGAILDRVGSSDSDRWVPRHGHLLERSVG
jgi:hypothetical protein